MLAYITDISRWCGYFRYSWIQGYGLQDAHSFSISWYFFPLCAFHFQAVLFHIWVEMVTTDQCCIQRRDVSLPAPTIWKAPAKNLERLLFTRPKSCAQSWVNLAPEKTNRLSQKWRVRMLDKQKHWFHSSYRDFFNMTKNSGNNSLLKRKDNNSHNTTFQEHWLT